MRLFSDSSLWSAVRWPTRTIKAIIHRDLKPSNILVSSKGHPYILDFGLAKAMEGVMKEASITMEGDIIGTLEFMAPEQAVGEQQKIGTATDIYSMGLILYRLLTKNSPIDTGGSRYALLKRMQNGEIASPEQYRDDLSPEIVRLVMRCLGKRTGRSLRISQRTQQRPSRHYPLTAFQITPGLPSERDASSGLDANGR